MTNTIATPRMFGRAWMHLRSIVLSREPRCVVCLAAGRTRAATDVDHVRPIAKGGTHDLANLQGLCAECHAIKTALDCDYRVTYGSNEDGTPIDPEHRWNKR